MTNLAVLAPAPLPLIASPKRDCCGVVTGSLCLTGPKIHGSKAGEEMVF